MQKKYGHLGYPRKENQKLRDVNQRSLGHSNQKLWPKVDLGEFHHVYPLEHLKSFATDRLWVYNAENFFVAFSRYIYSAVSTIKQNFKKWLFWDTLLSIHHQHSAIELCFLLEAITHFYRTIQLELNLARASAEQKLVLSN